MNVFVNPARLWLAVWPAVFLIMLAACSTAPIDQQSVDWQARETALLAIENWEMRAKLAVRTPSDSQSVNVNWAQSGPNTTLALSGPVGWGRAQIDSDGETLQLQRNGAVHTVRLDDSAAMTELLGWPLPVQQLPFWVRGLSAPHWPVDSQAFDGGLLRTLEQGGWQITYATYSTQAGQELPSRINFEGPGASGKIVIKRWQLTAP